MLLDKNESSEKEKAFREIFSNLPQTSARYDHYTVGGYRK